MIQLIFVVVCCVLSAQAFPSYEQSLQLIGVPDEGAYQHLMYPQTDIQDLGISSHDQLPPQEVKITRTIRLTVARPYPVPIPHKVPYPVHIEKPVPVEVTKIVKVPEPVPVEVIKSVELPVEVPKPYPVPAEEQHQHAWQPTHDFNYPSEAYSTYGEHQQQEPYNEGNVSHEQ